MVNKMKLKIKEKAFYHLQGRNEPLRYSYMYESNKFTREQILDKLEYDLKNFDFGDIELYTKLCLKDEEDIKKVEEILLTTDDEVKTILESVLEGYKSNLINNKQMLNISKAKYDYLTESYKRVSKEVKDMLELAKLVEIVE